MGNMPKFKFNSSITEEDLKKKEKEFGERTFFDPGSYDLKVIDAKLNKTDKNPTGMSQTDPTWMVINLTLGGIDARTINHYLLVPTVSDLYRKPGIKNPRIMFIKFREFIRGLGLDSSVENVQRVLTDLFSDPIELVGKSVSVVIGHEGPHTRYNPENKTYSIVDQQEKTVLFPEEFQDRDSAIAHAAGFGLELKPFTKVKKFEDRYMLKESKKEVKTSDTW